MADRLDELLGRFHRAREAASDPVGQLSSAEHAQHLERASDFLNHVGRALGHGALAAFHHGKSSLRGEAPSEAAIETRERAAHHLEEAKGRFSEAVPGMVLMAGALAAAILAERHERAAREAEPSVVVTELPEDAAESASPEASV